MAIKLNRRAFDHAKELIAAGKYVLDDRDQWSEHQPSSGDENQFIARHGFNEYAKWYLGIDTDQDEDNKGRYRFPYGDFEKVHRCGVLSAESRAAQYRHEDIAGATAHLHGMLDAVRARSGRPSAGAGRPNSNEHETRWLGSIGPKAARKPCSTDISGNYADLARATVGCSERLIEVDAAAGLQCLAR